MSFLSKGPKGISGGSQAAKILMTTTHNEVSVYEIGYLIVSAIPEEKVPEEADAVKKIIVDAGATVITDETPHREQLAYTISKKNLSGGYERHDNAYFGWIKFELGSDKIGIIVSLVSAG